ncbi:hypothetical protein D3C80_1329810 [compost metagenome]
MGVDIATRSATAVAVQAVAEPVDQVHQRIAVKKTPDVVVVVDQGLQQDRQIRRIPLAGHIAFGETDIPALEHAAGEAGIADGHDCGVAGRLARQLMAAAVRQDQSKAPPGPVRG